MRKQSTLRSREIPWGVRQPIVLQRAVRSSPRGFRTRDNYRGVYQWHRDRRWRDRHRTEWRSVERHWQPVSTTRSRGSCGRTHRQFRFPDRYICSAVARSRRGIQRRRWHQEHHPGWHRACWALLYRHRQDGSREEAGTLFLGINDDNGESNGGGFTVSVTFVPST
jgi:hypothetical protein